MRLLLLLVLLSVCRVCHADRDIVYSARYYTPPGSHRTSHFHIYRINPDGTGRMQLTFGTADEEYPRWSENGDQITFYAYHQAVPVVRLCKMDADGGKKQVIKILPPETDYPASPSVPGYRLENSVPDDDSASKHTLVDTITGRHLILTVPEHDDPYDVLWPMPKGKLIYAANNHNSMVGVDFLFYELNPNNGAFHYLTEGQFLAGSPDGSKFCTAPGRDTTPYEKRREPYSLQYFDEIDAQYQSVWFAPLYVRSVSGGKMRQITP